MTKKVAVIGLNGYLGSPVLSALTSAAFRQNYAFPIHAITRDKSKFEDSEDIKYFEASLQDTAVLKEALQGVDVLINLLPPHSEMQTLELIGIAADANVSTYFPSDYDVDDRSVNPWPYASTYHNATHASALSRSIGMKTVEIKTGIISDWFVNSPVLFFNASSKQYEKIGSGEHKVAMTSIADIANIIGSVAHLDETELPDVLSIKSNVTTPNDIVELYERAKGIKFDVSNISNEDAIQRAKEVDARGVKSFEDFIKVYKGIMAMGYADHNTPFADKYKDAWKWTKFEPMALEKWSTK